jgi:putative flippase GtrA
MIGVFIRFCIVGLSGLFVDFGITWYLKEKLSLNRFLANSLGFIFAASTNYILNRVWTFESQNSKILSEYSLFILISMGGLVINTFILWLLLTKVSVGFSSKRGETIYFYLCKLIAIGVVTVWNFLMNFFITFS